MGNAEWGNAGCGMGKYGMGNAECGMRNGEWGMGKGECGMRNGEFRNGLRRSAKANPENGWFQTIYHSRLLLMTSD
jgi:hypothetical protein